MILTVNIHPTAIKVARSGQGGRNVALEMTDATGGTVASIFPGSADGWDRLVSLAIEGRAMQEQADTDHAIAADVDAQIRRDGEALGRRIAADEGIEPEQLYVVVEHGGASAQPGDEPRYLTSPMPKAEAERCAREDAKRFAGRIEIVPVQGYEDECSACGQAVPDPAPSAQVEHEGERYFERLSWGVPPRDEGIEPKADPVPWPTGLCGHPVPPGAWAAGFARCRDDIGPAQRALFDEAAAPDLTVVDDAAGPEDDADGQS